MVSDNRSGLCPPTSAMAQVGPNMRTTNILPASKINFVVQLSMYVEYSSISECFHHYKPNDPDWETKAN